MIIILFPPHTDYEEGLEYVKTFKDINLEEAYHSVFRTCGGFYIRKGTCDGQDAYYGYGSESYYYRAISKQPHTLYTFNEKIIGVI